MVPQSKQIVINLSGWTFWIRLYLFLTLLTAFSIVFIVKYSGVIPPEWNVYLTKWTQGTSDVPPRLLKGMLKEQLLAGPPPRTDVNSADISTRNGAHTPNNNQHSSFEVPSSSNAGDNPVKNVNQADEEHRTWVQIINAADIRTDAKKASPEIMRADANEWFPVVRQKQDWIEVQLGEQQTGWVQSIHAAAVKQIFQGWQQLRLKPGALLYEGPDQSFKQAGIALEQSSYIPIEIRGQWIHIMGETGGPAWIPSGQAAWTYGDNPPAQTVLAEVNGGERQTEKEKGPLTGKTIVVDPGHGGTDVGAIGDSIPAYERDINLSVAMALASKLQAAGAHVILTRTSNDVFVSLESRANLSNESNADLFVSIHQNMFPDDPSISGTITFYDNDNSVQLAKLIEQGALESLGSKKTVARIEQDQLYVLTHNRRPAVLVEGCFMSNPKELVNSLLPEYHEQLASGIYEGIQKYFQQS